MSLRGATGAGGISDVRQLSRSVVSASLQLGEQIGGAGVWRALACSGASLGGGTVLGEVVGKVALQPVASINSAHAASISNNKGGLCIFVDLGNFITVGVSKFSIAFRCGERCLGGGRALSMQGAFCMGGFQPCFGQADALHCQGEPEAQPEGERGVFPGVGA